MARLALVMLALAVLQGQVAAADFTGRVIRILDGDTLEVLVERPDLPSRPVRIRLAGIDAPEKGQPFGSASRQSLADIAFQRQATIRDHGRDRYGRTIGNVVVDNVDLSAWQVQRGLAWVYRRYSNDPVLLSLEREARAGRSGLWADAHPTPPWLWRRDKRGGRK